MTRWQSRDLRFIAARGVEWREYYSAHWQRLTPEQLAGMTAAELRMVADVMDPPERAATLPEGQR